METNNLNGLILAAGLSSRMGDFKPLMALKGKTIIENSIDSMLLAGVAKIVVVTGYRHEEVKELLKENYLGDKVIIAYNDSYRETDMLTSIKKGLKVMPDCDGFFLLPGDMPLVKQETFNIVAANFQKGEKQIVFPTIEGYRKHPPLIDYSFISKILDFDSQGGLRGMWNLYADNIKTVPVEDKGCETDLDTIDQYYRCLSGCEQ